MIDFDFFNWWKDSRFHLFQIILKDRFPIHWKKEVWRIGFPHLYLVRLDAYISQFHPNHAGTPANLTVFNRDLQVYASHARFLLFTKWPSPLDDYFIIWWDVETNLRMKRVERIVELFYCVCFYNYIVDIWGYSMILYLFHSPSFYSRLVSDATSSDRNWLTKGLERQNLTECLWICDNSRWLWSMSESL